MIIPILIGLGAFALYEQSKKKGTVVGGPVAVKNPQVVTQPAQVYPFVNPAMRAPRLDTNPNSFPFYGGSQQFMRAIPQQGYSLFDDVKEGLDLTHSAAQVWDDLGVSDWFSDWGSDEGDFVEEFSEDDSEYYEEE